MKYGYLILIIAIIGMLIGCKPTMANSPYSRGTIFGKCKFCGKPGYSTNTWVDSSEAQKRADEGDKAICGSIVCGKCRRDMIEGT